MGGGDFTALILLLLIGFGAFFFGIIWLVWSLFAGMGRGVMSLMRGRPVPQSTHPRPFARAAVIGRICPRAECRKLERRPARFCSQCGARLAAMEVI